MKTIRAIGDIITIIIVALGFAYFIPDLAPLALILGFVAMIVRIFMGG